VPGQQLVDARDELREITLGLGHRERARRKRDAGQRIAAHATGRAETVEPVAGGQRVDFRAILVGHVRDDEILVRRQAEIAAMDARDLAQSAELPQSPRSAHAAGFDAQSQVPAPVVALNPSEAIAVVLERERTRGCERFAEAALHLADEPVEPAIVDRVFEPGALALRAVAEIALHGQHGFGNRENLIGRNETDHVREARIRRIVAVRRAEPPPTVTLKPASSPFRGSR
jgi:hypothetical protein